MNKKKYVLLLLVIVAGVFFCTYLITTLNVKNLRDIRVVASDEARFTRYILSAADKKSLFAALTSLTETTVSNNTEANKKFKLLLTNKWGVTREYTVFYADNNTVFLQEQGESSIKQVSEVDFFYHHQYFSALYKDRLLPEINVTVNEANIPFQYNDYDWRFLTLNKKWVSDKSNNMIPAAGTELPYVTIVSIDNPIAVKTDKQPDNVQLIIKERSTKNVVYGGTVETDKLPFPETNGLYDYRLVLEYKDAAKPYQGRTAIDFTVKLDVPETFWFSKERLIQGDILEVVVSYVTNPEDIYLEQSVFKDFRWYENGQLLRGYIPTNYNTTAGIYEITYGNRKTGATYTKKIDIQANDYLVQHLKISSQIVKQTQNEAARAEFIKYFVPVRQESASVRYYTEPFVIPAKGVLTTEFGQIRYYNNASTSSRHSGLDIAAPAGTEIVATTRGKVVLSMPLIQTGNTIVIDHGEGLFSVYFHMQENFVETGEIVERGQKIAAMGTTGFSTGPHLHFMISYYTMNIDPGCLLVGQPIRFSNYEEYLK